MYYQRRTILNLWTCSLLFFLVLGSNLLLVGSASAQAISASEGTTRAIVFGFSVPQFHPTESFEWSLAGPVQPNDTCRTMFAGDAGFSGWGSCSATGTKTFATAGIHWAVVQVRDNLSVVQLSRAVTLLVDEAPPSNLPVKVMNTPLVNVAPTPGESPFPVAISNWRQVSEGGGGMSEEDSENIERIALSSESTDSTTLRLTRSAVFALAVLAFTLGGVLVNTMPRL